MTTTTPPTEAPRLTNLLRASKQHQHPIQSRSLQYAQLVAQLESKRQTQIQDEYKNNSLSWALVKSHVGDKKVSSLEQQGATNFISHIIKSCEVLIDAESQEQQQILPVLAKQFYKLAWQEKHKGRVIKPAQIFDELKTVFGVISQKAAPQQLESALTFARKLVDWVERTRGDAHGFASLEDQDGLLSKQTVTEYGNTITDDPIFRYSMFELKESASNLLKAKKVNVTSKKATTTTSTTTSDIKTDQPQSEPAKPIVHAPKFNITYGWLREQCQKALGVPDMAKTIVETVQTTVNELQLQSLLFDLLGENGIEIITVVLENRQDIAHHLFMTSSDAGQKQSYHQQLMSTVSIKSQSDIDAKKAARKEAKKLLQRQLKAKEILTEEEEEDRQLQWLQSSLEQKYKAWKQARRERENENNKKERTVLELLKQDLPEVIAEGLPADFDTKRIERHGWQEFHIEPPAPKQFADPLIPISTFEEWAQLTFKGFTHLNRVQTRVYPAAYKTNENLLICAPTGCGKTNIALMTILREIGQHFRGGMLRKDEFKIIYVAPMKALAQEMVENFTKRLAPLGIVVREMTGDMQLSKTEVQKTQLIVTTPEKWDVTTRKGSDLDLLNAVKLLILDEVHLLAEDRGPVIESLVARTLRQVESSQRMIRIVGLSATLPNYEDVATFLRVTPEKGLFHFDNSYRPVPLRQQFIGVNATNPLQKMKVYNEICYEKVIEALTQGYQVMVFVHSRSETYKTARWLVENAQNEDQIHLFETVKIEQWAKQAVGKSANREMRDLFTYGASFHHAGMLRPDRGLVERLFSAGFIRVLCCTATLAWGVNLPAHTVIIKGTEIYDSKRGQMTELSMLDVMQIFGRAGRPQFDTSGEGIILTSNTQLPRYLKLLNHALPIESKMNEQLEEHLNAEIILGTVSNVREAIQWLSYTYMFVRVMKNPMVYGIVYDQLDEDPILVKYRRTIIEKAAKVLHDCRMIRFSPEGGTFGTTELGRVASHYYINHETIQMFNDKMNPIMAEEDVLNLICSSKEFNNIKVRDDEIEELMGLMQNVPVKIKGGIENIAGKVNVLVQAYISKLQIKGFALVSDSAYVIQSIPRIVRALFEICLKRGWPSLVDKLLILGKCIEKKMWGFEHPLRQFNLSWEIMHHLDEKKLDMEKLYDMEASEIGQLVKHPALGKMILDYVSQFPTLEVDVQAQPVTRTILRVRLHILATFEWNKRIHGEAEPFWIWVEDDKNDHIYHSEYFLLKGELKEEPQTVEFTIPIINPRPAQVYIKIVSDRWLKSETTCYLNMKDLILPENYTPNTNLLPLQPLPISVLNDPDYEKLYRISHFNPLQTQVFHTVYHSDHNILVGAPTGSGKTVVAELAVLRLFNEYPKSKVVYIAPLKALVRERMEEWTKKFTDKLGKSVVELTGDFTPDVKLLMQADIIITTPEKWDGISRNWQQRGYVQAVGLMIMDEIHLLGQERGAILEVIVSRMRYISWTTGQPIRMMGLSTTLANARDLADWLGIEKRGLYNFKPSVRPVPLTVHVQGFAGKHYCPRMQTMNKPAYGAILEHSRNKPVLIFVSSRRQTRLTAADLISYCVGDENPRRFLKMPEAEVEAVIKRVHDPNLKHTLVFGIGMHHAGLVPGDKAIVEDLYVNEKIQVLIATSTLAWGVNTPAHLVIIKGTEFYDPKTKRYKDYPMTDVLQMMGRAGRPQYDNQGIACVFVEESKKYYYKKFLYESFPVESSLADSLHDHISAEIVSGTIGSRQDAVDYMTWTFLFRRLVQNPTYYNLADSSYETLNKWLSKLIGQILDDLEAANICRTFLDEMSREKLEATSLGTIASFYYLSYKTAATFAKEVTETADVKELLKLVCEAKEYAELPVRHNEDKLNEEVANSVPWEVEMYNLDSPHVKTQLLLQAHFAHVELPIADYITDTKTVLDQTIRIIQACVDIVSEKGYMSTAINLMHLMQMVMQGRFISDNTLTSLPYMNASVLKSLAKAKIDMLAQFIELSDSQVKSLIGNIVKDDKLEKLLRIKNRLPRIDIKATCKKADAKNINVTVELTRVSELAKRAYLPSFPKQKDEGYWILIGDLSKGAELNDSTRAGELLALRRVRLTKHSTVELSVPIPTADSKYQVLLVSDCYIGLDQQYDLVYKE